MTIVMGLSIPEKKKKEILLLMSLMPSNYVRHPRVLLKFKKNDPAGNIVVAQGMHDKMASSTWLSSITTLTATLAAYQTSIDNYTIKEAAASVGTREDKLAFTTYENTFIKVTSERLREICQGVCDNNYVNALVIAESCNMTLKAIGKHDAQEWTVSNGKISGDVIMTADIRGYNHVEHSIDWMMTTDPTTPTSWYLMENEIIGTTQSTNTIHGLRKASTVYFRYRIIHPKGATAWSVTLSLVIT